MKKLFAIATIFVGTFAHAECPNFRLGDYTCKAKGTDVIVKMTLSQGQTPSGVEALSVSLEGQTAIPMACEDTTEKESICTREQREADAKLAQACESTYPGQGMVVSANHHAKPNSLNTAINIGLYSAESGLLQAQTQVITNLAQAKVKNTLALTMTTTQGGKTQTIFASCK